MTSCAISGVSGEGAGKSGAAVFEHGVGIAAWQGLEVGYEMDVVLEVPAPVVAVEETAVAEPVPVASGRKKVWMAEPLDSRPREGVRQMTSGAAVFGNGVGIASFREANLDLPGVEAESPSASESHEVPKRQPGLKAARSPGSGVAGFTYAGTGSATFKRFSPAKSGAPDAPEGFHRRRRREASRERLDRDFVGHVRRDSCVQVVDLARIERRVKGNFTLRTPTPRRPLL